MATPSWQMQTQRIDARRISPPCVHTALETYQDLFLSLPEDSLERQTGILFLDFDPQTCLNVPSMGRTKIKYFNTLQFMKKKGLSDNSEIYQLQLNAKTFLDTPVTVKQFYNERRHASIYPTMTIEKDVNKAYTMIGSGIKFQYKVDLDYYGQNNPLFQVGNPLMCHSKYVEQDPEFMTLMEGIITARCLIGGMGSAGSIHQEVQHFGFVEYVRETDGAKMWTVIFKDDTGLFYQRLNEALGTDVGDCITRNCDLIVPPETLALWGVRFAMVEQKANQMVIGFHAPVHQSINLGVVKSLASNLLWTDKRLSCSTNYRECTCGNEPDSDATIRGGHVRPSSKPQQRIDRIWKPY